MVVVDRPGGAGCRRASDRPMMTSSSRRRGAREIMLAMVGRWMATVVVMLAALLCRAACGVEQPQHVRPHILMMMADQLRADAIGLGARHGGRPNTPNLDALGAQGLRFTNMYSSTPTCTPARAAILTGQSPWNHGMLGFGTVAPRYPVELPRVLSSIGYNTSAIGKDRACTTSCTATTEHRAKDFLVRIANRLRLESKPDVAGARPTV